MELEPTCRLRIGRVGELQKPKPSGCKSDKADLSFRVVLCLLRLAHLTDCHHELHVLNVYVVNSGDGPLSRNAGCTLDTDFLGAVGMDSSFAQCLPAEFVTQAFPTCKTPAAAWAFSVTAISLAPTVTPFMGSTAATASLRWSTQGSCHRALLLLLRLRHPCLSRRSTRLLPRGFTTPLGRKLLRNRPLRLAGWAISGFPRLAPPSSSPTTPLAAGLPKKGRQNMQVPPLPRSVLGG